MIPTISLVTVTIQSYYNSIDYILCAIHYIPWLIFFVTGSLYLLIPYIYFAFFQSLPTLVTNSLFLVYMSLFLFCFACFVFVEHQFLTLVYRWSVLVGLSACVEVFPVIPDNLWANYLCLAKWSKGLSEKAIYGSTTWPLHFLQS